jgi:hypothetical protein
MLCPYKIYCEKIYSYSWRYPRHCPRDSDRLCHTRRNQSVISPTHGCAALSACRRVVPPCPRARAFPTGSDNQSQTIVASRLGRTLRCAAGSCAARIYSQRADHSCFCGYPRRVLRVGDGCMESRVLCSEPQSALKLCEFTSYFTLFTFSIVIK